MAKMKQDTTKKKAVNMQNSNGKSVTRFGPVANSRIDSMKKAGMGKVIGDGYKNSGGGTSYGYAASDAIKAGLKKSTDAAKSKKSK
jgi:hypothetical protein